MLSIKIVTTLHFLTFYYRVMGYNPTRLVSIAMLPFTLSTLQVHLYDSQRYESFRFAFYGVPHVFFLMQHHISIVQLYRSPHSLSFSISRIYCLLVQLDSVFFT